MDRQLAAAYAELSEQHWWWRARRRVLAGELARLLPKPAGHPGRRILEVGCASGANLPLLAAHGAVLGLEPDPRLRGQDERIADQALDASYVPAEPFDLVAMLDVLEHVEDRRAFLGEARRVLRPGGNLLLTVPAHSWLWTRHDGTNDHLLRYSRRRLTQELSAAGFAVGRMRFLFPSLVPAKLAVRLVEALRPGAARTMTGPPATPAEPWNSLAARWLSAEDRLQRLLRLPIGGSLLALAQSPPPTQPPPLDHGRRSHAR